MALQAIPGGSPDSENVVVHEELNLITSVIPAATIPFLGEGTNTQPEILNEDALNE